MKTLFVAAVVALTSLAPAAARAGDKGCSMIGSWSTNPALAPGEGGSAVQWMGTITGQSNSSGTLVVDIPVWPKVGEIDWVAKVTLRGAWERTGGNTFAFTQIGWIPGPDGTPILLAKNVGTETLTDDCNTVTVVSTMQMFLLTGEPITEALPIEPPMVAYRIVVERQ